MPTTSPCPISDRQMRLAVDAEQIEVLLRNQQTAGMAQESQHDAP